MSPALFLWMALLGLLLPEPWLAEARATGRVEAPSAASNVRGDPDWGPTAPPKAALHRGDLLGIELARSARPLALEGLAPRAALGLPALDALARDLGGARFEPEFPDLHAGAARTAAADPAADLARFWLVHLPDGADLPAALRRFDALPEVERAFPIARAFALAVPNDSLWNASYHFFQPSRRDLHAPEAWNLSTGDTGIVVAIIDTGVLWSHPDLAQQIWSHPLERSGFTGLDDDANGFIDDVRGWDFVDVPDTVRLGEDGRTADNDPADFSGHGTAVAGLVGARTNNHIGVAGTAWNVRLMPLRIGWSTPANGLGESDVRYIAQAVRYATRMGAHVINLSFTTESQPDLIAAVDAAIAAGITIVTASGNFGVTHYLALREDVIAVGATDADDQVAYFSTSGPGVDLVAPGYFMPTTVVFKTDLGQTYPAYTTGASGTSFSAPLVSGAVALLQAQQAARRLPPLTPTEALMRLMDTADDIAALNRADPGYGTGRLNLYRALADPPTSRRALTRARLAGPAVAVHRASGLTRIVAATTDGLLRALEGALGATEDSVRLNGTPAGGVAAAALGNGETGLFVATRDGTIHGYDMSFRPLPGWPRSAPVDAAAMCREPLLGDLDGDGHMEILWSGGMDGKIYAWREDGSPFPGFPLTIQSGADLGLALSDLDGASGVEIIVGLSSGIRVLQHDRLTNPFWTAGISCAFPPIVAAGPSGTPQVIALDQRRVVALGSEGQSLWARERDVSHLAAPIAADLDGDGSDEIVVLGSFPERVAVFGADGGVRPGWGSNLVLTGEFPESPTVSDLAPDEASGILLPISSKGLFAFGADASIIRSFPKFGGATSVPLIDDLDDDGRVDVLGANPVESTIYLYSTATRVGQDPIRSWPTARGNYARTGSHLYAPAISSFDLSRPSRVADLVATAAPRAADLAWTAPADSLGATVLRYEVRYSAGAILEDRVLLAPIAPRPPNPGPPGTPERYRLDGLEEDTTYTFVVRSRGAIGDWSRISNLATARTPSIPPNGVSDVQIVSRNDVSITLRWTATGDDGHAGRPARYSVRAAESPLDSATFESAPYRWEVSPAVAGGGVETYVISRPPPERQLWIALVAVDDRGYTSPLSNVVTTTTVTVPPGPVTDLRLLGASDTFAALSWTATGDDLDRGRPRAYRVRAAEQPLTDSTFDQAPYSWEFAARQDAGGTEVHSIVSLQRDREYWVALEAVDEVGNRSPMSNVLRLRTLHAPTLAVTDLRLAERRPTTVTLQWTGLREVAPGLVAKSYQVRGAATPLTDTTFDDAEVLGNAPVVGRGDQRQTITLPFVSDRHRWVAIAPLDSTGQRWNSSNAVTTESSAIPPSDVTSISLTGRTDSTLTFVWGAAGEDGFVGNAAQYELRMSPDSLTDSTFPTAPFARDIPGGVASGGAETATVSGYEPGQNYFAAVRAVDAYGNRSRISAPIRVSTAYVAPDPVADVRVTRQTDTSATLTWTATGDDGRVGRPAFYQLRMSPVALNETTFDAAPITRESPARVAAGQTETVTISGFLADTTYSVALKAVDPRGNRSALSNVVQIATWYLPPAPVQDLRQSARSDTSVTLAWTGTGEDGNLGTPTRYRLAVSESAITEATFDAAEHHYVFTPRGPAGVAETFAVTGLLPDRAYSAGLKAVDHLGNVSPLSNTVAFSTVRIPPGSITDLRVSSRADASIGISWTAPGDDGTSGTVLAYEVRMDLSTVTDSTFDRAALRWRLPGRIAGRGTQSDTLRGYELNRTYSIALKAVDRVGLASPLSNVVQVTTTPVPPGRVSTLAVTSQNDTSVTVNWTTSGDNGNDGQAAFYRFRAAYEPILSANFASAPLQWTLPATLPGGRRETVRLSGLAPNRTHWIALTVVDSLGLSSPVSNNVSTPMRQFPPQRVSTLRVAASSDSGVTLAWLASGDDGNAGQVRTNLFRAAPAPLTDANFEAAPLRWEFPARELAGRNEQALLRDLPPESHFYLALVAVDPSGNRSPVSNNVEVNTAASPPAAVLDLTLDTPPDTTVTLRWTASGANGSVGRAHHYRIRAAKQLLDASSFESAPLAWDIPASVDAGGTEYAVLSGFERESHYWIALIAVDHGGNRSSLSNLLQLDTPTPVLAQIRGVSLGERRDDGVTLSWIAAGGLGAGRPLGYRIRAAEAPIDEISFDVAPLSWDVPATVDAGGAESARLTGFLPERRYWIALAALEPQGRRSPISAVIDTWIGRLASGSGLALAAESQPARIPVRLLWRAPGPGEARRLRIFDVRGRVLRSVALEPFEQGLWVWDGRDRDGHPAGPGLYFARIEAGAASATARIVLLP